MQRLLPLLVLADIALIVVAMFDCMTSDEDLVRGLPRVGWVLLILLLSPIGPIMWFISRRADERAAESDLPLAMDPPGPDHVEPDPSVPARQLAPDDDPDFLRDLAVRAKEAGQAQRAEADKRRAEEERLRKWEADLQAREEKLRDSRPPTTPPAED
jgi:phospholipase D-like protein